MTICKKKNPYSLIFWVFWRGVVFLAAIAMNLYTLDTLPDMISESILPNQHIADQLRFLIS